MGLNRTLTLSLFALAGIAPCLFAASQLKDRRTVCNLIVSSLVSLAGFFITKSIIPVLKPFMLRANLFGLDINKKGETPLSCNDYNCVWRCLWQWPRTVIGLDFYKKECKTSYCIQERFWTTLWQEIMCSDRRLNSLLSIDPRHSII